MRDSTTPTPDRRPRRGRAALLAGGLMALSTAAVAVALHARQEAFPHPAHERLFPVCQGCHAGIETGDEARFYPPPERCLACHDGVTAVDVAWRGPRRAPSNLAFSHVTHRETLRASGEEASCQACHRPEGATARMVVTPATPDLCAACHGHEALDHPDGGQDCRLCHVALAEATGLEPARIAAFPRPSSHDEEAFLSSHGPELDAVESTCATCHARPSCARCHVDAEAVGAIRALAPDPRVEELTDTLAPEYPTPATHRNEGWIRQHGDRADDDPSSCATCHARPSCLACHSRGTPAVQALFDPRPGGPAGVLVNPREARARLHPAGFDLGHGSEAATGLSDCGSCHAESFCSSCHAGTESPAFHPVNFLETHGAPAYGVQSDCATCHSPELFCRSCHSGVGLATSGRLNAGFHDAQPFWLLGHGQAARQGLEACVTCHQQTDCASCHSPLGGWGVNPHGPGFEASRYRESATTGCILCHLGGLPTGGGTP